MLEEESSHEDKGFYYVAYMVWGRLPDWCWLFLLS